MAARWAIATAGAFLGLAVSVGIVVVAAPAVPVGDGAGRDDFAGASLAGWRAVEGEWQLRDGRAVADRGYSVLLRDGAAARDIEVAADVAYAHDGPHAAAGLLFRFAEGTGYVACVREVERGVHAEHGPWERPVVQLFRLDRDGMKLLQESKVAGARDGRPQRLKVVCRGAYIWVFHGDAKRPVLSEFDDRHDRAGAVGLWKDHPGRAAFDEVSVGPPSPDGGALPPAPLRTDWSWVRGAIYVRSNAVNSVHMWDDYWPHTATLDRELSYAAAYGFNMVQAYLHWVVWDRHGEEYLKRVDDFLARAASHGLKVNLILWDDCGHVEPSLAVAAPVPGRHNSQMMPNPSHRVRDGGAELLAHRDRFRGYVEGVVGRFKDDDRIAFWQLYNECMGPKERYRDGGPDRNLNTLLDWTRTWAKSTGTRTPVTATGGGFYGPEYSDFYTYHSYAGDDGHLPNADGGPEHLCTETLNRPHADLVKCVKAFGDKRQGFVAWELMIGRDNCRFPWGHPDGPAEPAVPFHGVVYPDGHPWSVGEVEALLGPERFAALKAQSFEVEYFADPDFKKSVKRSIVPRIDFNLSDEPGTGSPDASAGIPKDHFAVRYAGRLVPAVTGEYTLFAESDGPVRLTLDGKLLLDAITPGESKATVRLVGGRAYDLRLDYTHKTGDAFLRLEWSGPSSSREPLRLKRPQTGR